MHIHIVPNRKAAPTVLLRESYREGHKVCKRTQANLSDLSPLQIQAIRASLRGEVLQPVAQTLEICASRAHGHVQAVWLAMQRLGLASLLASKPCSEQGLVLAMVAQRIVWPATKLATTRLWHTSTLAADFGVPDASEDDLYAAMDWLLERQDRIQKKLAARHLKNDGLVLHDLSSSYFEGLHCPLAKLGYSRDGKRATLQVNYGLLTDERGCPVAISVTFSGYGGNTADSQTFMPQVKRLREEFGIGRMVMVGDRGMISQKAIDEMSQDAGVAWITALRSASIRTLVEQKHLQPGLFDERNLLELSSPDFPGERLLAWRNPELAKLRSHTRQELLLATEQNLQKIKVRVDAARLVGKDKIGLAVGKCVNQYQVAKHFELLITDNAFTFARKAGPIAAEAALDGLYIIRTSVKAERMDAPACVRTYKSLAQVDRAFRSLKGDGLEGAPDSSPPGEAGACAHLPVHAGLLRGVAHARGVARVDVRRLRSRGQGFARPGGPGPALGCGDEEGGQPHAGRWHPGAQLALLDGRALNHRAQHLSRAQRSRRRTDFPDHHYAHGKAKTRSRPDQSNQNVDRMRNHNCGCLRGETRSFGGGTSD